MKKILLAMVASFLATISFAQIASQRCSISYDFTSGTGWITDKHLYTSSCSGLSWLSGTQGSHTFSGQLLLNSIQDASMNRVYRSFTPLLGNTFIADFEAKVNNESNGLVGYELLALTQTDAPPLYDFSTSCATTQTANSGIMVNVQNANATGPMEISIISKYNTTASITPTGFAMSSNVTYYFRIKRESASRLTFEVFSDAGRTSLILRKSCITIDDRITALSTIQHANNPIGGFARVTSGYIDNVCIIANPDITCCTPRITGNNTICEEESPATYQVNAVSDNTYTWILPSGITYTGNVTNSQITITNWGPITTVPKQVDIKVKMYCHCDSFIVNYPVFVYPKRDPDFNFTGLGTTGTLLTDFHAIGNRGVAGTINHWEIYECDATGNPIPAGTTKPLRNIFWETSTGYGPSDFAVISNGSSLSGVTPYPTAASVVQPWPSLQTGHFYVVKHGMYYTNGTCGWKGKLKVFYISNSSRIYNLGEPNTVEFKANIEVLRKTEKVNQ